MMNNPSFNQLFNDAVLQHCSGDWVVGFSGGVDSRFLLQASVLAKKNNTNIRAIYVNHGLSANAQYWQDFCEQETKALGVAFEAHCVSLPADATRQGIEQLARTARYEVFERYLNPADVLLLGHHLSDQAETLIARLIRGSGVNGLSGIPAKRQLANGATIVRPLLSLTKAQIIQEAQKLGLQWIEDESNASTDFERNYIRQNIMPVLKARWPGVEHSIVTTAQNCQQDAALLDEIARDDLRLLEGGMLLGSRRLSLSALAELSDLRQNHVLRYWLGLGQNYRPGSKVIEQIYQDVILAGADTSPRFVWGDCVLRKYRDFLWCQPRVVSESIEADNLVPLTGGAPNLQQGQSLAIGRWATLTLTEAEGDYQLRFGQRGIKCKLGNQRHNKPLKQHFQEAGIPPWFRDSWPLLYKNDQLCAIPLLGLCGDSVAVKATLLFH